MEDITHLVARNLKKVREENKLSLDKLSDLTGVSKSMLGQIERGESSPTIATIWKISNGLKISFTSLLNVVQVEPTLVPRTSIKPLIEDDGKYRLYPIFPIEEDRRFEIYTIEIEPGGCLSAEPHQPGTQEFITVYAGELTLRVDDLEYHVGTEDSIRFRADHAHTYLNSGQTLVKVGLTIFYSD